MKSCIHCGRALPDTANFCPGCGTQQTEVKTDKWGVPQAAEPRQSAQQPQPSAPAPEPKPSPAPEAETLWAEMPAPEKMTKKKSGSKKRKIVLAVVLAVLAVAGVFAYRVLKHPSEVHYLNEDGELTSIEYYDGKSFPERSVGYNNDEENWKEVYRATDEAEKVDTAEIEDMDGVKKVEALECFDVALEDDEETSEDIVILAGYDWRGQLVAQQVFRKSGGEYVLRETRVYELDTLGNHSKCTVTTADGDVLREWEYENEYSFGRLVRSEISGVNYGYVEYSDDGIQIVWNDEPFEWDTVNEFLY